MPAILQVGQAAPEFDLPDPEMEMVSLAGFRNRRNVVIYFYPKDDTPGCTMESIEFSDLQDEFERLHAVVLGISMDDCLSHGAFRDKHGLALQLLADEEGEVCERYGVIHEREVEGHRRRAIQRSTFVVDKRGTLRHVMYGVAPRGHAHEVLNLLKEMGRCK